jgi:hypothetical protein
MTQAEFIRAYAARSHLPADNAILGFIRLGDHVWIALPCACDDEGCEGWAMVSAEGVTTHLELYAPNPIRSAFRALKG